MYNDLSASCVHKGETSTDNMHTCWLRRTERCSFTLLLPSLCHFQEANLHHWFQSTAPVTGFLQQQPEGSEEGHAHCTEYIPSFFSVDASSCMLSRMSTAHSTWSSESCSGNSFEYSHWPNSNRYSTFWNSLLGLCEHYRKREVISGHMNLTQLTIHVTVA